METEAQKPQNQKNYENCPKHIESPVLIAEHVVEYMMTAGALRVCATLLTSGRRRSQKLGQQRLWYADLPYAAGIRGVFGSGPSLLRRILRPRQATAKDMGSRNP
jgi:hypothetical protein